MIDRRDPAEQAAAASSARRVAPGDDLRQRRQSPPSPCPSATRSGQNATRRRVPTPPTSSCTFSVVPGYTVLRRITHWPSTRWDQPDEEPAHRVERRVQVLVDRRADHHHHCTASLTSSGSALTSSVRPTTCSRTGPAPIQERHPPGADRLHGLAVDVVDPDVKAGPRKRNRQRQADVAAPAHHADVKPKPTHVSMTSTGTRLYSSPRAHGNGHEDNHVLFQRERRVISATVNSQHLGIRLKPELLDRVIHPDHRNLIPARSKHQLE